MDGSIEKKAGRTSGGDQCRGINVISEKWPIGVSTTVLAADHLSAPKLIANTVFIPDFSFLGRHKAKLDDP